MQCERNGVSRLAAYDDANDLYCQGLRVLAPPAERCSGGNVPSVTSSIPAAIADFIETTNRGDSAAFVDTFTPDATLND